MDTISSTASTPSIESINEALLSQRQALAKNGANSPAAFASALKAAEGTKPTTLVVTPVKTVRENKAIEEAKTQAAQEVQEAEVAEEPCSEAKISRSPKMQCAEKATEVPYSDDDFGFDDFVDFINPLQHIPIIGTIYRELTGDTIKPEVQVAGSIAFGALTGSLLLSAATGIASAAIEQGSGKEPTVMVADALFGSETVDVPSPLTEEKIVVADASSDREIAAPVPAPVEHVERQPAAYGGVMAPAATAPTAKPESVKTAAATTAKMTEQASAEAQIASYKAGGVLPLDIFQDRMLKGLEKYAAAQSLGAKTQPAATVQ